MKTTIRAARMEAADKKILAGVGELCQKYGMEVVIPSDKLDRELALRELTAALVEAVVKDVSDGKLDFGAVNLASADDEEGGPDESEESDDSDEESDESEEEPE